MMKSVVVSVGVLLLGAVSGAQATLGSVQQGAQPRAQQEEPQAEPEQVAEPVPPPRVVGQAQSQQEWDAWQLVIQAQDAAQKAALARTFLADYPESGLSANAHYFIAQDCYEQNDVDNFILHAEKSLEELPYSVNFLVQLGFFYAEQGESEKAIDRATRALDLAEKLERPTDVLIRDWVVQLRQSKAEAHYALGRSYLNLMTDDFEKRPVDPNLRKAVVSLRQALLLDPRHDYAAFRLGFAYRNMNHAAAAMKAYARAVAIGGVAAPPAQAQLEEVWGIVKEAAPESQWAKKSVQDLIDEETGELQEDSAQRQQEIDQRVQELEQQQVQQVPVGLRPPPPVLLPKAETEPGAEAEPEAEPSSPGDDS